MTGTWAHWQADGFRVSVGIYPRNRGHACDACGRTGAVFYVHADRPDGSHGDGHFCEWCQPARGTLGRLRIMAAS